MKYNFDSSVMIIKPDAKSEKVLCGCIGNDLSATSEIYSNTKNLFGIDGDKELEVINSDSEESANLNFTAPKFIYGIGDDTDGGSTGIVCIAWADGWFVLAEDIDVEDNQVILRYVQIYQDETCLNADEDTDELILKVSKQNASEIRKTISDWEKIFKFERGDDELTYELTDASKSLLKEPDAWDEFITFYNWDDRELISDVSQVWNLPYSFSIFDD